MDPASLLRELRDGHGSAAVRLGLSSLLLGAAATLLVLILLSPAMDGLVGIPGHSLFKQAPPRVERAPQLTAAQRVAMRRSAVRSVRRELGVREWSGHENKGARIVTYRRSVVGYGENPRSAEPWCADFVSWAWRRAGAPLGFGGRGTDYVPELAAWAKLTHRWHGARTGYRPRPGDLVVYTAGGRRFGHVGMVIAVRNGRIRTIEGNFRDRVSRRVVKPWAKDVRGFVAPV